MVRAPSLIAPAVNELRVRVDGIRKYMPTILFSKGFGSGFSPLPTLLWLAANSMDRSTRRASSVAPSSARESMCLTGAGSAFGPSPERTEGAGAGDDRSSSLTCFVLTMVLLLLPAAGLLVTES